MPDLDRRWAPAYAAYGGNNRTHMLRVPEPGRVENRCVDGSANPYLAFTVLAAAGVDGIDRGLDPGEPNVDNLFSVAPAVLQARGVKSMPPTLILRLVMSTLPASFWLVRLPPSVKLSARVSVPVP